MSNGSNGKDANDSPDDAANSGPSRPPPDPALDEVFGVLSDRTRRCVLVYLYSNETDLARYDELVDVVAGDSEGDGDRRRAIEIELHHRHLPRLADADLVEFDGRSKTVRLLRASKLDDVLDEMPRENR